MRRLLIKVLDRNMVKEWDMDEYVMEKLRLSEGGVNSVEVLRKLYSDRDIGAKNWSLYKVTKGKVWYTKSMRRK